MIIFFVKKFGESAGFEKLVIKSARNIFNQNFVQFLFVVTKALDIFSFEIDPIKGTKLERLILYIFPASFEDKSSTCFLIFKQ